MLIRKAEKPDATAIAERALIAGEGIPAWLWTRSAGAGQENKDVGTNVSTAWIHDCRNTPGFYA
jgi:hypothetical protein